MFTNKEEFKMAFSRRMVEEYGRSLEKSHPTERYMVLGDMVRSFASIHWKEAKEKAANVQAKQVHYFSMEFLIGRLLTNNMMNLGIYEIVRDGLDDLGIDINELEDMESDAGLGNGGLGRLAACFMDSLTSQSYVGFGQSIRYEYGLFKQKIVDNKQVEVPDQWLKLGNVWEVRKPKHAVSVKFWGRIEMEKTAEGSILVHHVDAQSVEAVPYDMPIVGKNTEITNTLRLWRAEAADDIAEDSNFKHYIEDVREINQNLYPDDSDEKGKYLRLKQQYFFVSAGLQAMIKAHLRVYPDLDNFADKIVIQLNDTHPVLAIPELMRLLMDEHAYSWDEAYGIVSRSMAYTNHTILHEALEKWPINYVQKLLPRIYLIIEEINHRFVADLRNQSYGADFIQRVGIIKDGLVHMANLAVVASMSVNGVAQLHTDILIDDVFRDFYALWPEKFNNKTNGITHRRWLAYSNPELSDLIRKTTDEEFIYNPENLEDLLPFADDEKIQEEFLAVKQIRKDILADFIEKCCGISIDSHSIFDVQAKRFHAYKRQLLNVLHIIYLMQEMDENPDFDMIPTTFIFAGKAASAYTFAKKVIELIHVLANKINQDERYSQFMKIVFIPNYNVSIAELLMNAADVSEQISTAGKEASGTGNMKFMMNGALTLGTLDGANVEIAERVGRENAIIFGHTVESVTALRQSGYNAWELLELNPRLKRVVNTLIDGSISGDFKILYDALTYQNDEYLLLADFEMYLTAHREVQRRYQDRKAWAKSCLVNIAKSGYFSSDRTIRQYAEEIWDIHPLSYEKN